MGLQSSGAISLNDIHVEAGGSSGSYCTINDSDIRGLISKGSGSQMSFSEWYGASGVVVEGPQMNWNGDYNSNSNYYLANTFVDIEGYFAQFEHGKWGSVGLYNQQIQLWGPGAASWFSFSWNGSMSVPTFRTVQYNNDAQLTSGGWHYFTRNPPLNWSHVGETDNWGAATLYMSIWRSTSPTYPF